MAKSKAKKSKSFSWKSVVLYLGILGFGVLLLWFYQLYKEVYKANVFIEKGDETFLYIPTGSEYQEVIKSLNKNHYVKDTASFNWLAVKMDYPKHVKPGKYEIKTGMSNRQLISMLRAGRQTPVKLVFQNVRTIHQFAAIIAHQLEADSSSLMEIFNSSSKTENYGFTQESIIAMFRPNTYEFYWNTSAEEFCNKMFKEYQKFWNESRIEKAKAIDLTPVQITTIASIVEEETQYVPEKPIIAGVYINRFRKGMLLQADPTVKFAVGDFSIKRVLDKHTAISSPYNTYRTQGLPPGPICIPSASSLNAVLNYQHHEYLYFCAKADFSGKHAFAKTAEQHNLNANAYRRALNKRNIFK